MSDAYLTVETVRLLVPETLLLITATFVLVGGAFSSGRMTWNLASLLGLGFVAWALYAQDTSLAVTRSADGPLLVDAFGQSARWVSWTVAVLFTLLSFRAADDELATDYLGSLLLVLTGLMIVCRAGELVLLFLGLELISIPTYILLFLGRKDSASHEATTKYFFLSVLSSAVLLYGLSFLYGITGSTQLVEIRQALAASPEAGGGLVSLLPLALVLIFAGLGFKMAAVPFHYYAPDVYQGTTSGNAGLLAVVPKLAGLVALVRLAVAVSPASADWGWKLALLIAVVTMTLGNVLALWQQNVRRLLAYSSIAHSGYILMGVAVGMASISIEPAGDRMDGLAAAGFYALMYALATIGTFAALAYLGKRSRELDAVEELHGLARTYPLIAAALAVFMFSLTGIPPLAGFWGKFTLFLSALRVEGEPRPWFVFLAVAAAINAAIGAAYYLRIVAAMYFREAVNVPRGEGGGGAWLAAVLSAVLVLATMIYAAPLTQAAANASRSAQRLHLRTLPAVENHQEQQDELQAARGNP